MDQVRDAIRVKHYSSRTEKTYSEWIKRYILFHNTRHPRDRGAAEVQAFITYLATDRQVSAATQNQALSAVVFLYRYVLHQDIDIPHNLIRAEKSETLPVVLTHQEAISVIDRMSGVPQLMTRILYGSGLRLMECLRLRVKDIDFGNYQIIVHDGKGEKDRATILPESLVNDLQRHLKTSKEIH